MAGSVPSPPAAPFSGSEPRQARRGAWLLLLVLASVLAAATLYGVASATGITMAIDGRVPAVFAHGARPIIISEADESPRSPRTAATAVTPQRQQAPPVPSTPSGAAPPLPGKARPAHVDPCAGAPPPSAEERNTITFLVQNPRTGSLFLSGRLGRYATGRFQYVVQRIKDLTPRPYRSPEDFARWACEEHPGTKVIVWDSGATPNWVLQHWPRGTALVMTGDEAGRWGLYDRGRHWGPFGDDDDTEEALFNARREHPLQPIVLPSSVKPWFRQYADPKQARAFTEDEARYWPLGSRVEFTDLDPRKAKPPAERKFTVSLMASTTDPSRQRLATVLNDSALFERSKVYLHLTGGWHPDLNNEAYVRPETYAEILQDSVFAPCPKGHSLETFRFYEAIEAGAIPVVELDGGRARDFFPQEYFDAPILLIDAWTDMAAAIAALERDPAALAQQQKDLVEWYVDFMQNKARALEDVATAHWTTEEQ